MKIALRLQIFVGILCLLFSSQAIAQSALQDSPPMPERLRIALLDGQLDSALREIVNLQKAQPERTGFWYYLEGTTQQRAGNAVAAIRAFEKVEQNFSDGPWIHKARFHHAEVLSDSGDWKAAETIWESEVRWLRGEERQRELASIYFDLADGFSAQEKGAASLETMEYKRAITLYQKGMELDIPADQRQYALSRMAWCYKQLEQWQDAARVFAILHKEFPDPQALYEYAQAMRKNNFKGEARRGFEDLADELETQRGSPELDALHGLALYSIAYTFRDTRAGRNRAIGAFRRFLDVHPRHAKSARAAYGIAQYRMQNDERGEAIVAFEDFLERPRIITDDLEELKREQQLLQISHFEIAQALIAGGEYVKGRAAFSRYVSLFPEGVDWASSQRGIIDAEFSLALSYEEDQDWQQARSAYQKFLSDHPLDDRVREILYRLGDLQQQQAYLAEGESQVDFFHAAEAEWRRLIAKYPDSEEASHALFSIGYFREQELGDLEGAVESYRACDFGDYSWNARERLRTMVKPALSIQTERVWRSNEDASFELRLRNIESVMVEVYKLDLEAYFRKHLSIHRIEDLDLDLIAADQEFEVSPDDFQRFQPYTQNVSLPVHGVGVWAVVVSSKDKRATTLVIRSDIDVIVKSSSDSALIFAEDMRKMKGAGGVDLVLAVQVPNKMNPEMIEVTTGRDGVAQIDFSEYGLSSVKGVRVFAKDKRGVASTSLHTKPSTASRSLQPSGFVFTDAPAYQPGALVSWRAVLRDVKEGIFTFKEGEKWLITMTDGSGRTVMRETLALSEYGTIFGSTRLAAGAPRGNYMMTCTAPGGRKFHARFVVKAFEVKRVELSLEFDQEVYYRGDDIKMIVRAKYSYGEPVARAELRIDLPGQAAIATVTDENGEYHFSFDTREIDNTGALSFQAYLPQQNVAIEASALLAATGFQVGMTSPEEVYLLGREVPIHILTASPDGQPVAQALELYLLRRYRDTRSRWVDEEVSRMSVITNKDGEYTTQLQPLKGGQHILIAEGTDRFGNPVSKRVEFIVSGDSDSTQLRLLSTAKRVDVGGKMPLEIVNRAGKGLALLTFEGGQMLDYRVVMLEEGVQQFSFDVPDKFFPDLVVTANLMHNNRFYYAERGFGVVRNLIVKMTPRQAVVRPGETVEVDIEVRNQQGNPVQAELSFAAVDAALFELFPDRSGHILSQFRGQGQRRDSFTTHASNNFSYAGVSREIAAALLEEDARLKAEVAWETGKDRATDKLRRNGGSYRGPGDVHAPSSPTATSAFTAPAEEAEMLKQLGYVGDADDWNSDVGFGGGAGGKYGGRGGRGGSARKRGASNVGDLSGTFAGPGSLGSALVGQVDEDLADALTADWQPSVVTDRKGRATITFTAPQLSTRWRLLCRGVDRGTSVGQSEASVLSRADFFVELRTPSVFLEGDQAAVLARVHNLSGLAGDVTVRVEVDYPSGKQMREATLHFEGSAVEDVLLTLPDAVPAGFVNEVRVKLMGRGHFASLAQGEVVHVEASTARPVRVVPWGLAVTEQHSGELLSSNDFTLELPADGNYSAANWTLNLGLGLDQMLIEEALAGPASFLVRGHALRPGGPQRVPGFSGELQGILGVLHHLRDTRRTDHAAYSALQQRASGLITTLLAAQQKDGGWAWSSRRSTSQDAVSARAMIALESAREFGFDVSLRSLSSGRNHLTRSLSGAAKQQPFTRAIAAYALSLSQNVEFGLPNSLHRMRNRLSPAAAAYTALTLERLGSDAMAKEMLEVSLRRQPEAPQDELAWCTSPVELQALLLIACLEILPTHSAVGDLEQALMAQRPWYGNGAHGMALAALSAQRTVSGLQDRAAQITVTIDGGKPSTFRLDRKNTSINLEGLVTATAGKHAVHISLEMKGRGKPHFTATLEGFNTQPQENQGQQLRVWRTYLLAAPTMYRGVEYPAGFSVVNNTVKQWRNEITQLEFGTSAPMQVTIARDFNGVAESQQQGFFSVEIPLPAGTHVVEDSVTGAVESWLERDGRLFVDIGRTGSSFFTINFRLRGLVPGKYRLLPVTVRSAYDPSVAGVGVFGALEVLPRGVQAADSYRATPDELYKLGVQEYQRGDFDLAWGHLRQLDEQFGEQLRSEALLKTSRIMLELAVDRNDANRIVKFFEILKEKNSSLTVTFARMTVIAAAYRDLGEFQRASRVLSAVAEATFSLDLQVVRVLEEQDDFHGATEAMHRFWLDYPDFPVVVETALTMADRLLIAAPNAHKDRSLRLAHRDRAVLLYESVMLLQRFLSLYADDPIAADAALNLVSAHLDLEDFENASRLAAEFAKRYQEPSFNDAFVYTQAVAEWTLGNDKKSTKLLEGIANASYLDENGRKSVSENRNLALYILAQIYHAKRDFVHAADYYEQVRTIFADAQLVLEGFRRQEMVVNEVTEVAPGEKAKFELRYRNIDRAELLVYPVDLMTLYLREKNLAGITSVNLAGIEPVIRRSVKLPDNGSMRQQEYEVDLKLPEAGAYLVICRADAIHASGMVLVSDFELEVDQIGHSSVRVQAVDRKDGHYLRDVDVRVIGAQDSNFISGRTDPRGLYLADDFSGAPTVIARHGGRHYAFYRGLAAPPVLGARSPESQNGLRNKRGEMMDSKSYLDNVRSLNSQQMKSRGENMQRQQQSQSLGVELNKLQ